MDKTNIGNWLKIVYDIEVFPNFFCFNAKELNKDRWFRLKIDKSSDLHKQMRSLDFFLKQTAEWIAFNQLHYDNVILNYMFKNYQNVTASEFLTNVKAFNDFVIEKDDYDVIKEYKYSKTHFKGLNVDLFLYWSQGLRISKKISLKSLGVQLKHEKLQELPYEPSTHLTENQMLEVFNYCDNDVIITEKVYNKLYDSNSPKTGSVKLRYDVQNNYGLNCMSWDTPKIASEILAQSYANKTGMTQRDVTNTRFEKPDVISFKHIFKDVDIKFETKQFQDLWQKLLNSYNEFSETIIYRCNNTIIKLSYSNGGLHAVNKNEIYKETDDNYLITSDVASLYPTNIIGYKTIRFNEVLQEYIDTKIRRIEAKKSGNKSVDKFEKLKLNSVSGLLDSKHSWLYYPEAALKLRLIGQMQLTRLIEKSSLLGFQVISANTKTLVF
jgi:hypothetical protein